MRLRALEILVCPLDRMPLELRVWEESPVLLSPEERDQAERLGIRPETLESQIQTGVLFNPRTKTFYPITGGVPRLLPFPHPVSHAFLERYGDRLRREFPGFSGPQENPMPGEMTVLRTFSTEWVNYDWDGKAYWGLEPGRAFKVMHFMLALELHPLAGKRVLEVGIGIGAHADHIASTEGCELVGIDLSQAVEPAYQHFGSRNPFFHVVQASLFKPPFPDDCFDFVYSQGVLHHTHSTQAAVESVARLPRQGGRLYVWVYSPSDERRTILRRILYGLEWLIRPSCSRLPAPLQSILLSALVPLYMVHQAIGTDGEKARYGWREAIHAARDRFTPRYAHRHTDEEVCEWFRAMGYGELQIASRRESPDFVSISLVTCTGVDGVRQ